MSGKKEKILVLNGPNLNLLGTREPEIYGRETLEEIETACRKKAGTLSLEVDFTQSNSESDLVNAIQAARKDCVGILINAGAFTHTSVAILDALMAIDLPVIEVHLSNLFRREDFRQHSFISQAAHGMICGFRGQGYLLALDAMAQILEERRTG